MAFFSASRTVPAKRAGTGPEPFDRSAFVTLLIADSLHAVSAQSWDALLPTVQPFLRHAFLSALEDSGSVGCCSGWLPSHRLWCD